MNQVLEKSGANPMHEAIHSLVVDPSQIIVVLADLSHVSDIGIGNGKLTYNSGTWNLYYKKEKFSQISEDLKPFLLDFYAKFKGLEIDPTLAKYLADNLLTNVPVELKQEFIELILDDIATTNRTQIRSDLLEHLDSIATAYQNALDSLNNTGPYAVISHTQNQIIDDCATADTGEFDAVDDDWSNSDTDPIMPTIEAAE